MEGEVGSDVRLAILCRKLGNLWSEDDVVPIKGDINEAKMKECDRLLYGKLVSKSNVNFQAFLSTMRKAWKTELVECELIEPGFFSFSLNLVEEKKRVLETGPWSFSTNLLVLQQGDPDTPEHCYEFIHCAFWVHIVGLPRGRVSEEVIRSVAGKIGRVLEVKLESRGGCPHKNGKAKVYLNLSSPLKSGTIVDLGYKKLWVDFKYERLPHYCYSCGRIGHHATVCIEAPNEESGLEGSIEGKCGRWLKVEVREFSPYWKIFYDKQGPMSEDEETIPDTPREIILVEPEVPRTKDREGTRVVGANQQAGTSMELIIRSELKGKNQQAERPNSLKGKTKQDNQIILFDPAREGKRDKTSRKYKIGLKSFKKVAVSKKQKALNSCGLHDILHQSINEEALLETPIQMVAGMSEWTLVASSNKPPGDI